MTSQSTACRYAGAGWIASRTGKPLSPFGAQVADLLGELFQGIYHLPNPTKPDWTATDCIAVSVISDQMNTYDSDHLTRLVFLAHAMAIRVGIENGGPYRVKLVFWPRQRTGSYFERHPSLADAVAAFESNYGHMALEAATGAQEARP